MMLREVCRWLIHVTDIDSAVSNSNVSIAGLSAILLLAFMKSWLLLIAIPINLQVALRLLNTDSGSMISPAQVVWNSTANEVKIWLGIL